MAGKKLAKILDLVESLSWRYVPDTSHYDEYPNDKYTASQGNLEFDLGYSGLYIYEGYGNDKKQVLFVSDKNNRVKKLNEKLSLERYKQISQEKLEQEKKEKREKARIRRQGCEGDIDAVLKNL